MALAAALMVVATPAVVHDAGGGYSSFRNVRSGWALGVDRAGTAPGARIIQATPDTGDNRDWAF